MNRRGNLLDAIIIIAVIFGIAAAILGIVFIEQKLSTAFTNTPGYTGSAANQAMTNIDTDMPWTLDFVFVMLLVSFPILSMVLSFFNNVHPFFFYASIGISALVVIVGSWFATGYANLVTGTEIGAVARNSLPMLNFILSNYVIYAVFVIFMIMLGLYVKSRTGEYTG